jgi:hypothetical protein
MPYAFACAACCLITRLMHRNKLAPKGASKLLTLTPRAVGSLYCCLLHFFGPEGASRANSVCAKCCAHYIENRTENNGSIINKPVTYAAHRWVSMWGLRGPTTSSKMVKGAKVVSLRPHLCLFETFINSSYWWWAPEGGTAYFLAVARKASHMVNSCVWLFMLRTNPYIVFRPLWGHSYKVMAPEGRKFDFCLWRFGLAKTLWAREASPL